MTMLPERLLTQVYSLRHQVNAGVRPGAAYGARQEAVLGTAGIARACEEIRRWPGYRPTPFLRLDGLADAAGVGAIRYKDEAPRFGLGSFKALGGAYAVACVLIGVIRERTGLMDVSTDDLLSGRFAGITGEVTVTCATDGNHGRSVAWGAQQFGCNCVIYIHATVSEGREQAIARYGAKVVRTSGNYDASVRQASEDAHRNGWIVVSDTSYPGYMDIPRHVMEGYVLMAEEAIAQAGDEVPTHVLIPGGVGGFAAAVIAAYWRRFGAGRPRMIVVEPDHAACIHASAAAGRPTAVEGDLDTIMAGLACGEVSLLAWEILDEGMDDVLVVPDGAAADCMRLLARGVAGDSPLVAGESAVAGLAGLLVARDHPGIWQALALGPDSRVLLFGSEGATDPEVYREIVGRPAEEVASP